MNVNKRPYPPSWVDRFIVWIESLPIPIWAFYLVLYLIAALSLHLADWLNGVLPWGSFSFVPFYSAIWLPLALFVIHNTDRLAEEAINRFAPLVRNHAEELEKLRYQITTMPARTVLSISAIFIPLLVMGAIQDPELIFISLPAGRIHPLAWPLAGFFGVVSYSVAPIMIYHAIRQLTLVTKAYKLVDEVNLFHQQPLYAFSGLTMRTALYITYAGGAIYDPSTAEDVINLALSVVIIPASIAIVLIPLWGIHQRLMDAKTNVLEENSMQISSTRTNLYKAIDKKSYPDVQGLDSALGSLYKERDMLKTIPTWPWAPGAFRNFLSAILLPMVLWVLQTLVGRYL
jgi:uncharacterized membrane protein YvlD (DUF360 family)